MPSPTTLTELWTLASLVSGHRPQRQHQCHYLSLSLWSFAQNRYADCVFVCFSGTDGSRGGSVEVRDFKKRAKEGKSYISPRLRLEVAHISNLMTETISPRVWHLHCPRGTRAITSGKEMDGVMQGCLRCENTVTWSRGTSLAQTGWPEDVCLAPAGGHLTATHQPGADTYWNTQTVYLRGRLTLPPTPQPCADPRLFWSHLSVYLTKQNRKITL